MDPFDIAFVKGVIVFGLAAGTVLASVRLWLRARERADLNRLAGAATEESRQVEAELRGRIAELEERLDFAERLLTQEREGPRLPETRVPTPV